MHVKSVMAFMLAASVIAAGCSTTKSAAPHKEDADMVFVHGLSAMQKGDLPEAEKNYRKTLELDPKSYNARMMLGVTYEKWGKPEKATEAYSQAITIQPKNPRAYISIMGVYYDMHLANGMVEFGEKALANGVKPESVSGFLGTAYYLLGDNKKAEAKLRKQLELVPNDTMSGIELGVVLYSMGRYDDSLVPLGRAVKADTRSGLASWAMALSYEALGKDAEAVGMMKEALKRDAGIEPKIGMYKKEFSPNATPKDRPEILEKAKAELAAEKTVMPSHGTIMMKKPDAVAPAVPAPAGK